MRAVRVGAVNACTRHWQRDRLGYSKIVSTFHRARVFETETGWHLVMVDRDTGREDPQAQVFPTFTAAAERAQTYAHDYCEGLRRQVAALNREPSA